MTPFLNSLTYELFHGFIKSLLAQSMSPFQTLVTLFLSLRFFSMGIYYFMVSRTSESSATV